MTKIETYIDNLKINYIKKGTGKTVLILPGWGTVINTYNTLLNSISTYANVLCLDMPGFGISDEPKNSWNLDDYITFITKFIKSQNINELDVIGHSNGGRIIIKLMSKKDLGFKINKLILIGSAGIVHKKTMSQIIRIKTFKFCKKFAQIKPIKTILPNLLDKVRNHFGSADYKDASPIMRETMVKLINEDVRNFLPNIKVPTLLIWGENDTATPVADAEIMEQMIPDAGLIKVKGCSHYVFLENPSYVNIVIANFLTGGNNGNNN
ncbi:MAG: alpha/beta hydrolase [Clostridia bacterium]|nr:alpha/beta hydrolase [Clostridia bacterium]